MHQHLPTNKAHNCDHPTFQWCITFVILLADVAEAVHLIIPDCTTSIPHIHWISSNIWTKQSSFQYANENRGCMECLRVSRSCSLDAFQSRHTLRKEPKRKEAENRFNRRMLPELWTTPASSVCGVISTCTAHTHIVGAVWLTLIFQFASKVCRTHWARCESNGIGVARARSHRQTVSLIYMFTQTDWNGGLSVGGAEHSYSE